MGLTMRSNLSHLYSLRTVRYLDWSQGATASFWWSCMELNTHIYRKLTQPGAFKDGWWLVLMSLFWLRCCTIIIWHLFAKCWTILSTLSLTAGVEPLVLLKFHLTVEWKLRNLEANQKKQALHSSKLLPFPPTFSEISTPQKCSNPAQITLADSFVIGSCFHLAEVVVIISGKSPEIQESVLFCKPHSGLVKVCSISM